ncbi:MAG: HNH endonuclease signature motif containing protein [Nitrososphaera sp.]|jgi:hypothetical protein
MNKKQHDYWYPLIVKKQYGEYCVRCKKDRFILGMLGYDNKLCIDHIDNNNSHNEISNLQFLCKSCNTKKDHPANEPFRRDVPIEFEVGRKNMAKTRNYVFGLLIDPSQNGAIYIPDLVDDLAEYLDCSQQAVRNYLRRMCSKTHGSYTTEERNGERYLIWKGE